MNNRQMTLKELQEISLWQQLNRQLLVMKRRGKPVKNASLKSLQSFCLSEHPFSTIKSKPAVLDVPLSLVTDLKGEYMITLNLRSWTRVLSGLLPGFFVLDVERALADSLVALIKHHRRHGIAEADLSDAEEDEELLEFANQYMDAKESAGLDLPSMIMALYENKVTAIKKMLRVTEAKSVLRREGDLLYFDTGKVKSGDAARKRTEQLRQIYMDEYLAKVDETLKPKGRATWMAWESEIRLLLENKLKEGNIKESVRQYAESELQRYQLEIEMIDDYSKAVGMTNMQKIPIVKISPFYFLVHPFPVL